MTWHDRCRDKRPGRLCKLCLTTFFALLCLFHPVYGQVAEPRSEIIQITPLLRDGKLYVDADIDLELGADLRIAAEKGLALHFVLEVQIFSKSKWWWFNKTVVDARRSYRLSYNVLTRQWRVSTADSGSGDWALPQATLDNALSVLRQVRGWAPGGAGRFASGTRYEGRMRLRLDTARLPRPFQIDALSSSIWNLATPWKTFQLDPTAF